MKRAALYSALLHILLIALLLANLENPFASKKLDLQVISVDFVTIGEKTAAPRLSPQPESPAPTPKSPDKADKKPEAAADQPEEERLEQSPPAPLTPPEKVEEKSKEKAEEKPHPEAVPLEKPKPPKKKEPEKKPAKPRPKPQPKKAYVNLEKKKKPQKVDKDSKKKNAQDLKDLLKDLDTDPNSSTAAEIDTGPNSPGAAADSLSATITASEMDGVRNKIRPCWRYTSGRSDIIVSVEMELSRDGSVKSAKSPDSLSKDPNRRYAAERAVEAVLDPECQPLPLPSEKYEKWKHIIFDFDPQQMMR